ncbi:MAG: hypothetical protein A3H68_00830 [Candidatus Taylorbacteria bacterium RIFCSPLOWO2_02_FULL_46_40]|uniref:Uncharacterized protein n=2 Tax=Candidatus Tayloriibacteriota TaxID=1817919 RepID=A0A1G2NVY2_9BACT|nr:MAG: hypothetical protein A3H68_00830 [Candidatus Taylorbacteria bacterium RIFCSPLOWO2_02_FULL_46_40]
MQGVEVSHFNAALNALLSAHYGLMMVTIEEAQRKISSTFGKPDTLVIDGTPEIILTNHLRQYDSQAIIITEEIGTDDLAKLQPDVEDPRRFRTIFIADPMDRSKVFCSFLSQFPAEDTIGEVMRREDTGVKWVASSGGPMEITGGSSAITCVRRGLPIFSVMVNHITGQLVWCCGAGVYWMKIPEVYESTDLDEILKKARPLVFRSLNRNYQSSMRRFVTFTGKEGYLANLEASKLMKPAELETNLFFKEPGGPLRILYLSEFQQEEVALGFILANGEKIGEWIHWLPFARFVRDSGHADEPAFKVYEVFQETLRMKDTALMATPPAYSIFQPSSYAGGRIVIDVRRVSAFVNPSKIRSTILIMPRGNSLMTLLAKQYGHREIEFANEW